MFVVDASVAINWVFADEDSRRSGPWLGRLAIDDALVPPHFFLETGNAFVLAARRGRMSKEQLRSAGRLLDGLDLTIDALSLDEAGLHAAIGVSVELAIRHGLTVYEAAYLELAIRRGLPLATLDEALAAAAPATGVELLA